MAGRRASRFWSQEEDAALREAVRQAENDNSINWHNVASDVGTRNNKECRKRWVYALSAPSVKGPWDSREDRLLIEAVEKHGFKWALVSEDVSSRQPDQCSRRWHETLNPNISHARWALWEDQLLHEAVETYGRKWTEIVERFFPNRSPINAKNRYALRFGARNLTGTTPENNFPDFSSIESPATSIITSASSPAIGCCSNPSLLWLAQDHTQDTSRKTSLQSPPASFSTTNGLMQPIGLFDCTPSGEIALSPSLDTLPTKPTPQHFAPPTPPYALYPDAYPSSASVYQQAATTLYPDVSACTNPAVLPNGILPTQQSQTLWPPTLESTQAHQSETTSLHEPPLDLFDISLANGIIDCGGPPLATSSNPFLPDLAKPDAQLAQLALLSSDFQNPEVFSDQNRHEISSVHRHPQPHTFNS